MPLDCSAPVAGWPAAGVPSSMVIYGVAASSSFAVGFVDFAGVVVAGHAVHGAVAWRHYAAVPDSCGPGHYYAAVPDSNDFGHCAVVSDSCDDLASVHHRNCMTHG